jgi:hypothetical protein
MFTITPFLKRLVEGAGKESATTSKKDNAANLQHASA